MVWTSKIIYLILWLSIRWSRGVVWKYWKLAVTSGKSSSWENDSYPKSRTNLESHTQKVCKTCTKVLLQLIWSQLHFVDSIFLLLQATTSCLNVMLNRPKFENFLMNCTGTKIFLEGKTQWRTILLLQVSVNSSPILSKKLPVKAPNGYTVEVNRYSSKTMRMQYSWRLVKRRLDRRTKGLRRPFICSK